MPPNYRSLHGVDGLIVAVGEGGRIMHVADPTAGPALQPSSTVSDLKSVWVESPSSAWAVGAHGTILRWNGRTWGPVQLAGKHQDLAAVWGVPGDGVWIGGSDYLMHYRPGRHAGSLITTATAVIAIWGSSPSDVWFLCQERLLLHWDGERSRSFSLPGDPDEEWTAIAGSIPAAPVYIVGLSGFLMCFDRETWHELDSGTPDILTAALAPNPHELYVTTAGGQLRHFDGFRWHTVACSPFGALHGLALIEGVIWAAGARGALFQHRPDAGT